MGRLPPAPTASTARSGAMTVATDPRLTQKLFPSSCHLGSFNGSRSALASRVSETLMATV
jgi:hypothetical protein